MSLKGCRWGDRQSNLIDVNHHTTVLLCSFPIDAPPYEPSTCWTRCTRRSTASSSSADPHSRSTTSATTTCCHPRHKPGRRHRSQPPARPRRGRRLRPQAARRGGALAGAERQLGRGGDARAGPDGARGRCRQGAAGGAVVVELECGARDGRRRQAPGELESSGSSA